MDARGSRGKKAAERWRRRIAAPALALAAIPLLLGACGGSSDSTSTTAATTASSPTTATASTNTTLPPQPTALPSPGCGTTEPSGTTTITPTVDGKQRVAIVHVPTGYRSSTPVPLVVNMHGSQSSAVEQEDLTDMNATADTDTFVVVYPQADIFSDGGYEWNVPGEPLFGGAAVPAGSPDDVTFITQLVGLLEHYYCIDTNRVYATGFSGGARMASQLGCDASSVFAAVAPVSGLRLPSPCPSTRPVPVIAFHGTADRVDPYGGNGQAYWTYSVPGAALRWGVHDGCSSTPQLRKFAPTVVITQYSPCKADTEVLLFSITGEGHEWPGGPRLAKSLTQLLGPQTTAVSANNEMWAFFMAHPMPAK